jgi:hypothetical protein
VPVDPDVIIRTLPNGIRTYVRATRSRPDERSCGW